MASANTLSNNEGGASAVDIASSVGTWGGRQSRHDRTRWYSRALHHPLGLP
jgi:hypothetical protein